MILQVDCQYGTNTAKVAIMAMLIEELHKLTVKTNLKKIFTSMIWHVQQPVFTFFQTF